MNLPLRRRTLWLGLNALGICCYLKLASSLWAPPDEYGMPGGPGDAFYWLLYLVPILVGFLTLNFAALTVILRRGLHPNLVISLVAWFVVAALWGATVSLDHERSVRYIEARYV